MTYLMELGGLLGLLAWVGAVAFWGPGYWR